MSEVEKLTIEHSEEFASYLEALCTLASQYIVEIRVQYADKAFEMYQNETVRKLVLAYGEEVKKLRESRLSDFKWRARGPEYSVYTLEDTCLNKAHSYADAIKLFFDIQ